MELVQVLAGAFAGPNLPARTEPGDITHGWTHKFPLQHAAQ